MKKLKSSKLRTCIIVSYIFLITINIFKGVVASDKRDIVEDLPQPRDFEYYLSVLEKIVDFFVRHKLYVDINVDFGLFAIDLHLKKDLKEKRKGIPSKIRSRLEQLLMKNDVLIDFFHYMVHKNKDVKLYAQDRKMAQLFYNKTTWPRPSDNFNTNLLKQTKIYNPSQLEKIYGNWDIYYTNVFDYAKYKPSPDESDDCIEYLSRAPPAQLERRSQQPICLTPNRCKKGVKEGSEFGYGLAHRILFLIIARFSRGCAVFSEKEDKYKADKYCMRSYNEAQYIALNNFQVPDLMLEQIALCGILGHAQFYTNYWIKSLLEYQTPEGCFTEKMSKRGFDVYQMRETAADEWTIANKQLIMNGQCNPHLTAVAACTLSNVLRYIMETYY